MKSLRRPPKLHPLAEAFVNEARRYVGYRSNPGRDSSFGKATGFNGLPWGGSMLEVAARAAKLPLTSDIRPSFVSPASSLNWFVTRGFFHAASARNIKKLKPGDISFYIELDGADGKLHELPALRTGVVSSVSTSTASYTVISGEVASGLPKGPQDADGVYEREIYLSETIGFGRLPFRRAEKKLASSREVKLQLPPLYTSDIETGTSRPAKPAFVRTLQEALHSTTGEEEFTAGKFDAKTRRALRTYARSIGVLHGDGLRQDVLDRLGSDANLWQPAEKEPASSS